MTVGSSTNESRAVVKIVSLLAPRSPHDCVCFSTSKNFARHPAQSVPHDRSPGSGKKIIVSPRRQLPHRRMGWLSHGTPHRLGHPPHIARRGRHQPQIQFQNFQLQPRG